MDTLQSRYKCPSCWGKFSLEEIKWIATSSELVGDPRLGEYEQLRFLPRHFTPNGMAIDEKGGHCSRLACPNCHLEFPRAYLESKPFMTSIIGGQGSGKTFFLLSMANWISRSLPVFGFRQDVRHHLDVNFKLEKFIEMFFPTGEPEGLVELDPTGIGENAVEVRIPKQGTEDYTDTMVHEYIVPYMYSVRSIDRKFLYSLCFYDHAGETFRAGERNRENSQTNHLGSSDALFFIFDPTQNLDFVKQYKKKKGQPKNHRTGSERNLSLEFKNIDDRTRDDPFAIFSEMARRIQTHYQTDNGPLKANQQYDKPIIIVVTKCDTWKVLLEQENQKALEQEPVIEREGKRPISNFIIQNVSANIHSLLQKYHPRFVNAVDDFASDVTYIPVSATGKDPEGENFFMPGTLSPIWIGVPFLYALAKHENKLVEMV